MRKPDPSEFVPLPWYSWDSRPETVALGEEEAETALFLDGGDVGKAAARLKVTRVGLNKTIRKSPQLQRLIATLRDSGDECSAPKDS
jgi:hypothetical protein